MSSLFASCRAGDHIALLDKESAISDANFSMFCERKARVGTARGPSRIHSVVSTWVFRENESRTDKSACTKPSSEVGMCSYRVKRLCRIYTYLLQPRSVS